MEDRRYLGGFDPEVYEHQQLETEEQDRVRIGSKEYMRWIS